ncbi:uncharacterized protein YbcI [Paenibacillus shirakamiensis]|uniref:Uncharacterized protein YbcI n=1 Tax=Paenibacillus shirakamiensis TaxID=1265935 RepID=A0ABS4JLU3_9BACL|nr:Na-translocating system protein MpsC family protein [Paenibacillus shirakamiensis]MBP2001941.1 uncharacterized protein YbcI [Paenibacillus shirakamiensis]
MEQLQGQQTNQVIASFIGKLLREHFGKGPESVIVSAQDRYATVLLKNFLTSSERVLLSQNQDLIIHQMRAAIMKNVIPELSEYIRGTTDITPEAIYYDWNLSNKTGMLIIVFPTRNIELASGTTFLGQHELEQEVIRVSEQVQRAPRSIASYELNPRTLLIVRTGVLTELEQELIHMELGDLLKSVKRNLEKGLLVNGVSAEHALRRPLLECFIDWDYVQDTSMIVLITQPPCI